VSSIVRKRVVSILSKILTIYDMRINHCRNARICQKIIELDVSMSKKERIVGKLFFKGDG